MVVNILTIFSIPLIGIGFAFTAVLLYLIIGNWRQSILVSALIFAVYLILITQTLGFFNSLNIGALFLLWATYIFIVTSILIKNRLKAYAFFEKEKRVFTQKLSSEELVILIVIACICLGTLLSAALYPPNTWDSMTYHLSRVGYWAQNQSVSPYSTHNLRQLSANPLSEYFILNLYLLTQSDRLSNLVQWFSMLGSLVGVSLIAQSLGASRKGQIYSALFCATIPMGILQSSSTQNDYVTGFWILCAIYFLIAFWKNRTFFNVLCLGISIGLSVLTKGTAYIYCTPILALFLFVTLSLPINRALKYALAVNFLVLILNATHFYFNQSVFSHPLGLNSQEGVMNTEHSVQIAISNSIKNFGLSLQTTIPEADQAIELAIESIHSWIGISTGNQNSTFNLTKFHLKGAVIHEDGIGNHLHLLLIPIAIFLLFIRRDLQMTVYVVCLVLCYILFGALLKWQPWGNRLLLPWFLAWAPIFGVLASNFPIKFLRFLLIGALSVSAFAIILLNQSRPLVLLGSTSYMNSYIKNYFVNNPELYEQYNEMARYVNKTSCDYMGIISGADDWDYPLRQVLTVTGESKRRLIYPVNVKNESNRFESQDNSFTCLIIDTSSINLNTIFLNPLGDKFERVFMNQKGTIYQRVIP